MRAEKTRRRKWNLEVLPAEARKITSNEVDSEVYTATHQVVGRDFSENIPAVASLAGWLGHEASLKSKHTKYLPTS